MATIFSRIIEGELPGHFVWRDDTCVAFLSINPIQTGHTLVVPRLEIDHWLDLPPEVVRHLTTAAQTIGKAQQQAFPPRRVGLIVAGLEVPHVHLHVLPFERESDLDFRNAAPSVPPGELVSAAAAIRAALRDLGCASVAD